MRSKWRKFACFAVALFLAVGLFSIDINAADKWLTKDELDSVKWLPADVTLIDKIRENM